MTLMDFKITFNLASSLKWPHCFIIRLKEFGLWLILKINRTKTFSEYSLLYVRMFFGREGGLISVQFLASLRPFCRNRYQRVRG